MPIAIKLLPNFVDFRSDFPRAVLIHLRTENECSTETADVGGAIRSLLASNSVNSDCRRYVERHVANESCRNVSKIDSSGLSFESSMIDEK